MLAAQIQAERPDAEVLTIDGLAAMGRVITLISEDGPRIVFYRLQWIWDVAFFVFAGFGPSRRAARSVLGVLGSRGVLRAVDAIRPDVIVSTYPQTTEVLGRLRRKRKLDVPVCSAITDLAAMHYWAAPGVDLHLITHPESIAEVRRVAGSTAKVVCVRGLTDPAFLKPQSRDAARDVLGLPRDGQIVLVSGGGWGVGDLIGAAETALGLDEVREVVCLCGRNEALKARLIARFSEESRVRVEGFTDRMPEWLAAGDVLVHSTGGLTVLEALMRGCRVVSYGWGRGHIRVNNRAFARFGLADVAADRDQLESALQHAFADPRRPDLSFAGLPSAATLVLSLAST